MELIVIERQDLKNIINEAVSDAIRTIEQQKNNEPYQDLPELINRKQVCDILKISYMTLDAWVRQDKVLKYRIGNAVRFKKAEILAAIKSCQKFARNE